MTEILETFPPVFCFPKSRVNENGGNVQLQLKSILFEITILVVKALSHTRLSYAFVEMVSVGRTNVAYGNGCGLIPLFSPLVTDFLTRPKRFHRPLPARLPLWRKWSSARHLFWSRIQKCLHPWYLKLNSLVNRSLWFKSLYAIALWWRLKPSDRKSYTRLLKSNTQHFRSELLW